MHPPVHAVVPVRLVRQLINVHVDVTIRGDARTIGPYDSWVPHKPMGLSILWVKVVNRVLLRHQLVDEPIRIALEAVRIAAALPMARYIGVRFNFSQRIGVTCAKIPCRDRVQHVRRERGVVQSLSVGRELYPVEAFLLPANRHATLSEVERVTLVRGHVVETTQDGEILCEAPPGFARAEIHHDEARSAFVGRVYEIGDAMARGIREIGIEIEAEVIEVRIGIVHARWKREGLVDGIICKRYGYKFRASRLGVRHRGVALGVVHRGSTCIDCPERFWTLGVGRRDVDGLDADEG